MSEKPATREARITARRVKLNAMKIERGCTDCGYSGHPAALSWDHLGDKLSTNESGAFAISWAWGRIMAEIAKCEVVCLNCHAIRTAARGYTGGRRMHGVERERLVRMHSGRPPRTECPQGHPYDEQNTYVYPAGKRSCRLCKAVSQARWRSRKRERLAILTPLG